MKHGLSGAGVVTEADELEALAQRRESWRPGYRVDTPEQEWAFEQLVVNSLRIDQCQRHERALRADDASRAGLVWEIDRKAEAAVLGDKLARKPEVVATQLRQSRYGCEWLMDQCCNLGLALQAGSWSDEHLQRALDLKGVPKIARAEQEVSDPALLLDEEYRQLEALVEESYQTQDEHERVAAKNGVSVRPNKQLALLLRYEAAFVKRVDEARKTLQKTTSDTIHVFAKPRPVAAAPVEEPPPPEEPPADQVADEAAEKAAFIRRFLEIDAELHTRRDAEAGYPMPTASFRDAIANAPAPPSAQPMNRKQRKALARQTAKMIAHAK